MIKQSKYKYFKLEKNKTKYLLLQVSCFQSSGK